MDLRRGFGISKFTFAYDRKLLRGTKVYKVKGEEILG